MRKRDKLYSLKRINEEGNIAVKKYKLHAFIMLVCFLFGTYIRIAVAFGLLFFFIAIVDYIDFRYWGLRYSILEASKEKKKKKQ